jgi:hypothetical protein
MKNISTGTGIALLAGAIVAYPIIDRVMPRAEAGATHVAAVTAAATAQVPPEPTIVWYGISSPSLHPYGGRSPMLLRAWSDGKVEGKAFDFSPCVLVVPCGWQLISDPNSGYSATSDINFDSKVDGADLSQVLNDWGDAPRQDIPPSTCPLNLINP